MAKRIKITKNTVYFKETESQRVAATTGNEDSWIRDNLETQKWEKFSRPCPGGRGGVEEGAAHLGKETEMLLVIQAALMKNIL